MECPPLHDHFSGNTSPRPPPKRYQDKRLNCHTHHPRHTVYHHLRDPKHCHSPNSVLWTMVDCARPRLHRPKHAFAPRSHKNQTSQGLDPNLYTRIDTIAPTPHANFGRGQLFPFIANPFTMLGCPMGGGGGAAVVADSSVYVSVRACAEVCVPHTLCAMEIVVCWLLGGGLRVNRSKRVSLSPHFKCQTHGVKMIWW